LFSFVVLFWLNSIVGCLAVRWLSVAVSVCCYFVGCWLLLLEWLFVSCCCWLLLAVICCCWLIWRFVLAVGATAVSSSFQCLLFVGCWR
jgi:hypothetical protein